MKAELLKTMQGLLERIERTKAIVIQKDKDILKINKMFPNLPNSHSRKRAVSARDVAQFAMDAAKKDYSHCVEKMVDLEKVEKVVSMKGPSGQYKLFTKTFDSEVHAQNWENKMSCSGYKILEVSDAN